jgi:hypothetical protein
MAAARGSRQSASAKGRPTGQSAAARAAAAEAKEAAEAEAPAVAPEEGDVAEADAAPEAAVTASEPAEGTQVPDEAPEGAQGDVGGQGEAASGGKRRYEAMTGLPRTRRGHQFVATPDDPRVKSGWAKDLGPADDEPPAEVAKALG